ncbi:vWA domain-containing protein [Ruegeria lacuscaerulensis]|uniref:vWA domain-containing protein n=1 Tax=Ruegeria lacuscaerulensis TaxID=55218 RepID=UPI00147BD88A|nr:VWA domain-containing protein [Ruegeria lacuscaerulensis]
MTDDLDHLKSLMDAATPAPDSARRANNLDRARKSFARAQGSRVGARPTVKRGPVARLTEGAIFMLNSLTSRGVLTATTALGAIALVLIVPQMQTGPLRVTDQIESRVVEPATIPQPLPQAEEKFADAIAAAPQALSKRAEGANSEPTVRLGRDNVAEVARIAPAAPDVVVASTPNTEAFANADINPLKVTAENPVSTFSIDVDTASYAIVRSSLLNGQMPPKDAVRVEEMLNYFPYAYPAPDGEAPFRPTITVSPTPWNAGTQLVHIGIQGALPQIAERPPLNLVFLIDSSGSMQDANKLPLLKQSFRLLLSELGPEDQVSIVTYAGNTGQVLEPTLATERSKILAALDKLEAGGGTAGQAGLQQAYQVAEEIASDGEVTRVILATDGDFNVGLSDPEALKDFIARKRDSGTYLSVLGFGRGNLDDATMQALAQNGNGQAAYIDTLGEARKVLVDQLTGVLFPIANDVKIQVEFNPAQIAEYRLIGYETRALQRQDFDNDAIDAGDIGAGHSVTAIYEVTPVGSDAIRNGPLRYGASQVVADTDKEIGYFKLRYKQPGSDRSQLIENPIRFDQGVVTDDVAFSHAIAGYAQALRGGEYLGNWSYPQAIDMATAARGDDPFGYRAEAIMLMRLAQSLAD